MSIKRQEERRIERMHNKITKELKHMDVPYQTNQEVRKERKTLNKAFRDMLRGLSHGRN